MTAHLILDYHFYGRPLINSASVLKPIYVWLGMKKLSGRGIHNMFTLDDFEKIITQSDNDLTTRLIEEVLPLPELTEELNILLPEGVDTFEVPASWGRFQVTAGVVFWLYKKLAEDDGSEAKQVLKWMTNVEPVQRFNIDSGYPVKAGWDLTEDRKLVLLVVKIDAGKVKVLAASYPDLGAEDIEQWKSLESNPEKLIGFHKKFFRQELKTFCSLSK